MMALWLTINRLHMSLVVDKLVLLVYTPLNECSSMLPGHVSESQGVC